VSKILVAFATKNGSTEEVARAIAETMRDDGCLSMSAVPEMCGRWWLGGT